MLDICLVVVGVGLIIVSYIVSDKLDGKKTEKIPETAKVDIWTEKEEKRIRERIEDIIADKTEDAMIKTDDQLSQITNEKIMAVSEFSDQILEKMKQNHTEIVFLYDMLNEKDTEVKTLLQEININTTKAETLISSLSEQLSDKVNKTDDKIMCETPKTAMDLLEQSAKVKKEPKKGKEESDKKKVEYKIAKALEDSVMESRSKETPDNKNAQILKLYEEGNSIVEIAKTLGLGQGEVKLVVDLYQGVRK